MIATTTTVELVARLIADGARTAQFAAFLSEIDALKGDPNETIDVEQLRGIVVRHLGKKIADWLPEHVFETMNAEKSADGGN